jgi:hypothetical protein
MCALSTDTSLLGRVFDSYQNMTQIAACVRETARQRSLKRVRVLELSRRTTGLSDYLPEAVITNFPTHSNDAPILSNPVSLPYPDKSFHACLISDVYEHVAPEMRPGLLSEMLRVTEGLVLVGCPNGNEFVSRLDRMVFDFIWGKYGERFTPLAQHVEFGVEPIEEIVKSIEARGADRVTVLPANYVYRWIHLILIYFDLQHQTSCTDVFEPFNRIYNERLSPYDYREPCYRYLILVPTIAELDMPALNNSLTGRFEKPASIEETDALLVQTFRELDASAADRLRASASEIARLRQRIAELEAPTIKGRLKRVASGIRRLVQRNKQRA